jgi:hypothetical protein
VSAVNVFRLKNGVVFVSDGATYDDTGVLRGIHSKVFGLSELSCILGVRGDGRILSLLLHNIRCKATWTTFDNLLGGIVAEARDVSEMLLEHDGHDASFELSLGGRSEERNQWETYRIRSHTHPTLGLAPWTVHELVPTFAGGAPDIDAMTRVGIKLNEKGTPIFDSWPDLAKRLILAQRISPMQLYEAPGAPMGYGVGGFIQITELSADGISSRVVQRWPDVIGQKIDPSHDPDPGDWQI